MPTQSVILAGIGGQGILLASEIIARAALAAGFEVKTNETHGMAQRGGAVTAQVRFGDRVHSPLIPRQTAKVLAAFEILEALRAYEFLAPDGTAIVNTERRVPVTVSCGEQVYPSDIEERVLKVYRTALLFDARKIAQTVGNPRVVNVVVLGALAAKLELPNDAWQAALTGAIKPKFLEINRQAFAAGFNEIIARSI